MSQDLAARIRDWLDADPPDFYAPAAAVIRAMLHFADELSHNQTGNFFAIEIRDRIARALGISDSPAVTDGVLPVAAGVPTPDWRRIAVMLARKDADRQLLSTAESDALWAELAAENEREWGTAWERRTDAASGGECA